MRTPTWRALLVAPALPLLLVAACGDDDDGGPTGTASPAQFCAQVEAAEASFDALDEFEPGSDAFDTALASLRRISPPAEIRADWAAVVDSIEELAEVFDRIDFSDPDSLAELEGLEDRFAEVEESGERITDYVRDECGIDLDG